MKKTSSHVTPYGYSVFPNPVYFNSRPSDKHCSNCCRWSKLSQWCSRLDEPVCSSKASRAYCKGWEWVTPKYLCPGMEGHEKAEKEGRDELL
jgi:hypothetical protein